MRTTAAGTKAASAKAPTRGGARSKARFPSATSAALAQHSGAGTGTAAPASAELAERDLPKALARTLIVRDLAATATAEAARRVLAARRAAIQEPSKAEGSTAAADPAAATPGAGSTGAATRRDGARSRTGDPVTASPDMLLARAFRIGLGSALIAAASGGRIIGGTMGIHLPGESLPAEPVIDFGVGLSDAVLTSMQRGMDRAANALAPVRNVLRGPVQALSEALLRAVSPTIAPVQERGRLRRTEAEEEVGALAEALLPVITELVLERIDIAEVIAKIDLQEVIEASMAQIDIAAVIEHIDLDAALEATMERVDITEVALQHIDMARVLDAAMSQVDVKQMVRKQLEGMDITDMLLATPSNIAGGALRQTTRFVRRG